ncbi:hypothetical protein [Pseudalkalibacillus caeni]|uniref:Lipoprotein n=1 Tax=Exobacillus caeni TaxID=2574798 RepID=A0A5R9F613_9BACL|nr:hypothetical protein [Pseudalkalibacillus caeni]TLS39182.1 hypothetical protein FCL54_02400 [Pseudalkalibacillus caeni]
MTLRTKIMSMFIISSLLLAACGQNNASNNAPENNTGNSEQTENADNQNTGNEENSEEEEAEAEAEFGEVYKEAVSELAKAQEDQEVDYDKVIELYNNNLQSLVQKRDGEFEENIDQQITTALQAGKEGSMDGAVVKQIFDKLMQKVFYNTIKHEFTEISENWGNTEEVTAEVEEAKEYYAILESTVEKRDAAYGTTMVDTINGGFNEIESAIENNDEIGFQLGKQVVDKTLMKTFYLAAGALENGYASKAAKEAKEHPEKAKVEQAEGWAFFQSLTGYLGKHAPEETELIEKQFSLESDVAKIDPEAVNKAFIRGFSKIALHEYEESEENWGEDKAVITALEGALFVDIIADDIKRMKGEDAYSTLNDQTASYLEAVKAGEKEKAEETLSKIETTLNELASVK